MMHFGTSRRRCLYGAATASLIALYPGARVVWAQNGAAYDLIDLGPFDVSVPVESGYSITGVSRIGAIAESGDVCGRFAVSDRRFSPAIWPSTGELRRLSPPPLAEKHLLSMRPVTWRDDSNTKRKRAATSPGQRCGEKASRRTCRDCYSAMKAAPDQR
ncbi:MAG: hypothetical protein R2845_04040 [Thermomicrobiales bacterium]